MGFVKCTYKLNDNDLFVLINSFLKLILQKRRRNLYLASNISPPNTRQSVKNKKLETRASSPPLKSNSRPNSPPELAKKISPFPSIPNLPSGLTIERVGPGFENKVCVECKLSGKLPFNSYITL